MMSTSDVQYRTLHDAAAKYPGLAPGTTEIWYMKPEWFRNGSGGEQPDPANLDRTHIHLGSVAEHIRERLWIALQGEIWSPGGEARDLIRQAGLKHTSMSVGDVIVQDEGGVRMAYVVASSGFDYLGVAGRKP